MRFLLDTNVVSEQQKPQPSAAVDRFLRTTPEDDLYLSVVTVAELSRGIALMAPGQRRTGLLNWLATDVPHRFGERLLPVTIPAGAAWGELMALSKRDGLNLSVMDGFLAATAAAHGLGIATRNTMHFAGLGLTVLDPWAAA